MDYFEKVKTIISETLNIDPDRIVIDATLAEDLEIDSLDAVEIIMALESEFGIEVSDEALENIKTVRDIVALTETDA